MAEQTGSERKRPRAPVRGYRRRRRVLAVGVALLCLLGAAAIVPDLMRLLGGPIVPTPDAWGRPSVPTYAFDIPHSGEQVLQRPVSVASADGRIYVSDSLAGHVAVFRAAGTLFSTIGADRLEVPLYVAIDEARNELLVTDRVHAAVIVFDVTTGSFVETITPIAEETVSAEATSSAEPTAAAEATRPASVPSGRAGMVRTADTTPAAEPWSPLAIDVAEDGTLYVSDIAKPHRVWHLERSGERIGMLPRSAEETAAVETAFFDYPNAVKSLAGRVWVADSNNRRLVEFDPEGEQVRSLPLGRLIRGFDVLMAEEGGPVYFALVDAFSHEVVILSEAGSEVARIGGPGGGPGDLTFPNDVAVAGGIAYIADTGNARVQVWEWDGAARSAAAELWPGGPGILGVAGAVLLLSPLLLLFNLVPVSVVADAGALPAVRDAAGRTRRWGRVRLIVPRSAEVVPEAYPWLPPLRDTDVSRPDSRIVAETYRLDVDHAETLTLALQARSLLTTDPTLQRVGKARGLDVYDVGSFVEEFSIPAEEEADPPDPSSDPLGEQDYGVANGT